MSTVLTLFVIAVIGLFTLFGAKRGLIRTAFSLCGTIIAFFIARWLTAIVTPLIAGQIPLPGIGTSLTSALNKQEIADKSYQGLINVLTERGFPEAVSTYIADRTDFGTKAESFAVQVSSSLDYIIAYVLCFVAALIVCYLLLSLLVGMLEGLMKMPILHLLNVIAGGALGFATGFVFIWILLLALNWTAPIMDACFSTDIAAIISGNKLLSFIYSFNPFILLLPAEATGEAAVSTVSSTT